MILPTGASFSLTGKRALVVGASRGIGAAAAVALARAGAHVTAAARSTSDLEELVDTLVSEGCSAQHETVDATDPTSVERLFDVREAFDVVVNSVGTNRPQPLVETSDLDISEVLDLNLKPAFYIARSAMRTMIKYRVRGSIITVSSQMGHVGSPGRSVYAATKHAIEGMTKSLAWEGGQHGIRVNTVCPTFIETELTAPMLAAPEFRDWAVSQTALGRIGRLDEVMGPIVFLASDASTLMTGSALMLDAGWTAR